MNAVAADEIEEGDGVQDGGGSIEEYVEVEARSGAPVRHIDPETAMLARYAASWIDVQQTRKALAQRELPDEIITSFLKAEAQLSRALTKTLRHHPLWPWLSQYPGLGGAHTALVIGKIGDPRRYPGQRCSEGHYLPPLYAVGSPCPVAVSRYEVVSRYGDGADSFTAEVSVEIDDAGGGGAGTDDRLPEIERPLVCPGRMLPPRETTGVRSLWHWAGLHVTDDGTAPRKRKGIRGDWEPRVRASVMQPGGIAEQIVRLNVPKYADIYRAAKERLQARVAETGSEIQTSNGDVQERTAEPRTEIEVVPGRPLRPFQADRIARKVAAKAFLGDLLVEWKRLAE